MLTYKTPWVLLLFVKDASNVFLDRLILSAVMTPGFTVTDTAQWFVNSAIVIKPL